MKLEDLSLPELEVLLMGETIKLTRSIRAGSSAEDKENQRHIIEEIQNALQSKKRADRQELSTQTNHSSSKNSSTQSSLGSPA